MTLSHHILTDIEARSAEALQLLLDLAQIPAPSNQEEQRAEFCLNWLRSKGARNAYIDEVLTKRK